MRLLIFGALLLCCGFACIFIAATDKLRRTVGEDGCKTPVFIMEGNSTVEIDGIVVHNDKEARAALGMPPCDSK